MPAGTADLVSGVRDPVAYASSVMTPHPGDTPHPSGAIATGTPAGVGPLGHGDRVVVGIERVGRLEVGVDAFRATPHARRPGRRRG
ncbi:fumarylacetoacetate hydrolase family protein [Streptomyces kanasensis]|uniref:fumarylacetoacetate hydrolase family protein n=1 Tax=Streptomyces kanasensis TaxID=936756 RepID=UPI0037021525